jgi:hypothetical protein
MVGLYGGCHRAKPPAAGPEGSVSSLTSLIGAVLDLTHWCGPWDFAVHYRGPIDVRPLEQIGWGRAWPTPRSRTVGEGASPSAARSAGSPPVQAATVVTASTATSTRQTRRTSFSSGRPWSHAVWRGLGSLAVPKRHNLLQKARHRSCLRDGGELGGGSLSGFP